MSTAFARTNGPRQPPNPQQIQKLLDENGHLIQTIQEYQSKGKVQEVLQYQTQLHRNLVFLATIADNAQNVNSLLPVSYCRLIWKGPRDSNLPQQDTGNLQALRHLDDLRDLQDQVLLIQATSNADISKASTRASILHKVKGIPKASTRRPTNHRFILPTLKVTMGNRLLLLLTTVTNSKDTGPLHLPQTLLHKGPQLDHMHLLMGLHLNRLLPTECLLMDLHLTPEPRRRKAIHHLKEVTHHKATLRHPLKEAPNRLLLRKALHKSVVGITRFSLIAVPPPQNYGQNNTQGPPFSGPPTTNTSSSVNTAPPPSGPGGPAPPPSSQPYPGQQGYNPNSQSNLNTG
ncbi:hypothetical protein YQE_08677, partial [Dendroctonus ponderosae]